jgi:hypothetical protein
MDFADFVPPEMLPTRVQNANFSLSQREFKIVAGRRDRNNPDPGRLPDLESPRSIPQSRCCSRRDDISDLTQSSEHGYPTIAPPPDRFRAASAALIGLL